MTPASLRRWREKRMGWTQEQSAEAMGISARMYQRYESGEWPIPLLVELATEALTNRREQK